MEILKHRVLKISDMDNDHGAEIDIRDHNGKIVLSHDIHTNDNLLTLEQFLTSFNKEKLLAINIKSTGIEFELKQILEKNNVNNYFTFDWPIPYLLKAQSLNLKCAFRISEYEKDIIPNCSWVWLDCFKEIWYDEDILHNFEEKKLHIAIVSPELHGRSNELAKVKEIVKMSKVDAICTDLPQYWI